MTEDVDLCVYMCAVRKLKDYSRVEQVRVRIRVVMTWFENLVPGTWFSWTL